MASEAIRIENLRKYFPPAYSGWRAMLQPFLRASFPALEDISLTIPEGESVALVGANGAGKSTLLRILATLLIPTAGRAAIAGYDVASDSFRARQKLGYHTGGEEGFYSRLTGGQNLRLFAVMNNLARAEASKNITEIAELLGIRRDLGQQARTYSSGMLQRLSLARALLHQPSVLLLDEPTRSLDPASAVRFREFLKTQIVRARGATLLFASHSLEEVEALADRIILMDQGRVIRSGSPREICAAAGCSQFTEALLRLVPQVGPNAGALEAEEI